jgi:hypothetical protein
MNASGGLFEFLRPPFINGNQNYLPENVELSGEIDEEKPVSSVFIEVAI